MTYLARTLLSFADGRHVAAGETVELSDEAAAILLAGGAIEELPLIAAIVDVLDAADVTVDELTAALPQPPSPPARRRP